MLQQVVDQFVIHFDARGTSRRCFQVLQDQRGLSVQFMLDIDGTIYQTLDAKEAAWHATKANGRSVGIEIANIGAYPVDAPNPLAKWYQPDSGGRIRLVDPEAETASDPIDPAAGLRPIRGEKVVGTIQGQRLEQYDFTPQQYEALARLTATLCTVFPKIRCDYPRDEHGQPDPPRAARRGLCRATTVSSGTITSRPNKVNPGPAFQWDRVIQDARRLMPAPLKTFRRCEREAPSEPRRRKTRLGVGLAPGILVPVSAFSGTRRARGAARGSRRGWRRPGRRT